ncbi:MAG: hypothetical protein KAQ94_00075 [Arcobacteraceae bacterium]|nr:hypothetical protein [Arcobacteraceae bacterium]
MINLLNITQNHINNLMNFHKTNLDNPFNDNQINDILSIITNIIKKDEMIINNKKEIPKNTLYLFNLISNYQTAYIKSKKEYKTIRINTLESLGKGNKKRIQKLEDNKNTIDDKSQSQDKRIIAYFENIILEPIIKGNQKYANLILSFAFIYKDIILSIFHLLFKYNKDILRIAKKMDESLEFFEYTYLAPSKIVNSITILIYLFIKENTNISKQENLKFTKNIINIYFPINAPILRKDFLDNDIYCAGIYNSLPIFQWNTSTTNKIYYNDENIKQYQKFTDKIFNELGILKYILIVTLSKNLSKDDRNTIINQTINIKNMINNLPTTYLKSQFKLNGLLYKKPKKTFKYYLLLPISLIFTKFVALVTKFTLR